MFGLFKKKRKGFVLDLYHHLSRALFMDIDTGELIEGKEALRLKKRLKKATPIKWVDYKQGYKADVWKNGKPSIVYGNLYEL